VIWLLELSPHPPESLVVADGEVAAESAEDDTDSGHSLDPPRCLCEVLVTRVLEELAELVQLPFAGEHQAVAARAPQVPHFLGEVERRQDLVSLLPELAAHIHFGGGQDRKAHQSRLHPLDLGQLGLDFAELIVGGLVAGPKSEVLAVPAAEQAPTRRQGQRVQRPACHIDNTFSFG
jgi:hypothetical protein